VSSWTSRRAAAPASFAIAASACGARKILFPKTIAFAPAIDVRRRASRPVWRRARRISFS
jgi:hypothetical protein